MSQNDYVIANQTTPLFRADLNTALQALASNSSGATAPATTYANMLWYDTATNILKMRSEADDAWIALGTLDQSANTFTPAGVATQTTSTWEAGTDTTESLVSAAKIAAAIAAYGVLGVGQTWQDVTGSRAYTTVYQNTVAVPISVSVVMFQPSATGSGTARLFVSSDNVTFIEVARAEGGASADGSVTTIVPPDHYYKVTQTDLDFAIVVWAELRP